MARLGDTLENLLKLQDEESRKFITEINQLRSRLGGRSNLSLANYTGIAESMVARDLIRELNELGRRDDQVGNMFQAGVPTIRDGAVDFPYFPIYTKRLPAATASIVIPIPPGYRNIIIKGSGSVDVATSGNIWAQANEDDGASSYDWHLVSGDGTSVTATEDTSFHGFALGVFGTTGAGAGINGSFCAQFLGYDSSVWMKNCISTIYTAEFNAQHFVGSTWTSTDPIRSLEIFGTDNTLAKGSANLAAECEFSVYMEK